LIFFGNSCWRLLLPLPAYLGPTLGTSSLSFTSKAAYLCRPFFRFFFLLSQPNFFAGPFFGTSLFTPPTIPVHPFLLPFCFAPDSSSFLRSLLRQVGQDCLFFFFWSRGTPGSELEFGRIGIGSPRLAGLSSVRSRMSFFCQRTPFRPRMSAETIFLHSFPSLRRKIRQDGFSSSKTFLYPISSPSGPVHVFPANPRMSLPSVV